MRRSDRGEARLAVVVVLLLCVGIVASCGPSEEKAGAPVEGDTSLPDSPTTAGETAAVASDGSLAGTTWRLVEFQSMDDAIGKIIPDDPSLFTMVLNGDGSVNMKLDCNRASGTWSAEPSSDGSSGRFEFGPLAVTRALCPPPNLDERIARDAEFIRSYVLKDGRLYLSLMADGGIYAWETLEEAPVPLETE